MSAGPSATPAESISEFRVRYAETDQMGVVYHANYLVWCEIGRTDFIRERGMTYADMESRGFLLAVTDVTMRIHASARYDDAIRVTTRLAGLRSRALDFAYEITRASDGARIASATTTLTCINPQGRPVTIAPEIRALLEPPKVVD